MDSPALQELLAKRSTILKILWCALSGSIVLYAAIPFVIAFATSSSNASSLDGLMYGIATLLAVISVTIYKVLFSDAQLSKRLNKEVDIESLANNANTAGQSQNELRETLRSLSPLEQRIYMVAQWMFIPYLLCWVLNESVAILGIALAFASGNGTAVVPFAIAGLALNGVMFPKLDALSDRARSLVRSS